jgi:hypothetical protein
MAKEYTIDERLEFIPIFRSNATDVSRACKAFGISRTAFYEWYNNTDDKRFRDAVEECREEMKDFGESQLLTLMKGIPKLDATGKLIGWTSRPDTACIIFYNKTKNKDRGYDERSIIKREGELPWDITVNVSTPEEARMLKDFLNAEKDKDAQPK